MQKEHKNSYLSLNELIYHSAIIGFVGGFIEMLYGFYQVYVSELGNNDITLNIFLYINQATSIISFVIYAVVAAIVTYPFYKKWAKAKGGLTIVLNTTTNEEQNT